MHTRIGVVADDHTGGTDVAVALRRCGLRVILSFGIPDGDDLPDHDAMVIALKSRMLPVAEAVDLSVAAVRRLRPVSDVVYFKYCSTFDSTPAGNIGPVLDALRDELSARVVVTTPSSPEHSRTQYEGHLFVGDTLLSDSHMRHHPLTPMTDSRLARLLEAQTDRPIGLVRHAAVRSGADAVRAEIARADLEGIAYLFVDAVDRDDLDTIAAAADGSVLFAGGAGLAGALGRARAARRDGAPEQPPSPAPGGPAAVLAGSCSAATLEQISVLLAEGRPSFRLDPRAGTAEDLARRALTWFDGLPVGAPAPLFFSSTTSDELARLHAEIGRERSAEIVESATGAIAAGLVARGVRRIIAAGGETSGAVVTALGVTGGVVGDEEATGVPWIHAGGGGVSVLLKSGNFGDPGVLARASATAEESGRAAAPAAEHRHRTPCRGIRSPERNLS